MSEQTDNSLNFEDGEGADLYDFSWESCNEDVVISEIASFNSAVNKVSRLLRYMLVNNNYKETAREYSQLLSGLGMNSWIQQFYYANKKDYEPYMRGNDKPKGYYDWPEERRKAFDFGLKCQRDAAWACKPLDEIRLLMMKVPLQSAFKLMQGTIILGDAGFDENMYSEIDRIVREINEFLNKTWTGMENIADRRAFRYYKENHGKISPDSLKTGYRKERLNDYRTTFLAYCSEAGRHFKINDQCVCGADLNFFMNMSTIDDYMRTVADGLNDSIDNKLEKCMEDSKKLAAVLVSRNEQCATDIFKSTMQILEDLNSSIYEFCELGLNMCKNYRGRISAAPYCFMKYPSSFSSIKRKYGFEGLNTDPLSVGARYAVLMSQAEGALSLHCREYVYNHGQKVD